MQSAGAAIITIVSARHGTFRVILALAAVGTERRDANRHVFGPRFGEFGAEPLPPADEHRLPRTGLKGAASMVAQHYA